uniref:PSIV CAPSID N-TERMINAL DOMAIN n=1 Tax=Microcebus murinus TaxID=30608 RepID=UPI0001E3063A|nr:Chain A, PSIV CAPSID N-TERMINAL DOMAIN [Microcebus murinus]
PVVNRGQGWAYEPMSTRTVAAWIRQTGEKGLTSPETITYWGLISQDLSSREQVQLLEVVPGLQADKDMLGAYLEERAREWDAQPQQPLPYTSAHIRGLTGDQAFAISAQGREAAQVFRAWITQGLMNLAQLRAPLEHHHHHH